MNDPAENRKVLSIDEFKKKNKKDNIQSSDKLLVRKQFNCRVKESKENDRALDFIISTGSVDRDSDTLDPEGWDFGNYKDNPVVLWAHDYKSPSIAKSLNVKVEGNEVISTAQFMPSNLADHDWVKFSDMIYQMYLQGYLSATSVGFDPTEWEESDERDGFMPIDFKAQELLEYSAVPVPANPEALVQASKGIDLKPLKMWAEKTLSEYHGDDGLWIPEQKLKSISSMLNDKKIFDLSGLKDKKNKKSEIKYVPNNVSDETAPEDEEWDAPDFEDFNMDEDRFVDLSDSDKRYIAGFYAFSVNNPPEEFADLKLPHHRPSDGAVVWNGVTSAAAYLSRTEGIPADEMDDVEAHLGAHYEQFDEVPPWEEEEGKSRLEIDPNFIMERKDNLGNLIGHDICPECNSKLQMKVAPELLDLGGNDDMSKLAKNKSNNKQPDEREVAADLADISGRTTGEMLELVNALDPKEPTDRRVLIVVTLWAGKYEGITTGEALEALAELEENGEMENDSVSELEKIKAAIVNLDEKVKRLESGDEPDHNINEEDDVLLVLDESKDEKDDESVIEIKDDLGDDVGDIKEMFEKIYKEKMNAITGEVE